MLIEVINNKDVLLYTVVIALIIISIMMVYLVYSQNKQLTKELIHKDNTSKEMQELKELSKELENAPKGPNIDLTAYEEEQEASAIISYEELVNTGKLNFEQLDEDIKEESIYEHEETFLKKLKQLKYLLTK